MEVEKTERQSSPYPLRMDARVRKLAQAEADRRDRSLHWIINEKLKEAFGLKVAA